MEIETAYQDALNYLYSFVDFSLTRSFRYAPENFDLDRMREFMQKLGQPHTAYPVIHVAGTKGKGSISALCASALRDAGYRVGLYTSPHLQDYAERIQLNGQPIPHADLVSLVDEIKPLLEGGTQLTTFEITTALAFLYFARQGATAAVFEVGLGGRLDATNVVTPIVAVIASLSYDHTAFLGNTLTEIATEKAGIIKPGVPVVASPQKEEARLVLERIAAERSSPLYLIGREYLFKQLDHSLNGGQDLQIWPVADQSKVDEYLETGGSQIWEPTQVNIPLLGYHQVENAATAYVALQIARQRGLAIEESAIRKGFKEVFWPGRFEILQRNPPVVIDSAHNRDSALKLRLALDDYFPGMPVILVFGASEDKDIEGMYAELMPRVSQVIATRSYHPRAKDPEELVELAHRYGRPAKLVPTVEDALEEALQLTGDDTLILVTGSLFVAAGARETWYQRYKETGKTEKPA
jgi:dihydrofolate synthase/folylpolyglutamate synthase